MPRPVVLAVTALTVILAGAAGAWLHLARETPPLRITTDDPAVLAQGGRLYAEHCAACHGAELEGEPDWRTRRPDGTLPAPPHDATGHTWHHSDDLLFAMTKNGVEPFAPEGYRSTMPAFAGILSDDQILAVLAYIKSQWPEEILRAQAGRGE